MHQCKSLGVYRYLLALLFHVVARRGLQPTLKNLTHYPHPQQRRLPRFTTFVRERNQSRPYTKDQRERSTSSREGTRHIYNKIFPHKRQSTDGLLFLSIVFLALFSLLIPVSTYAVIKDGSKVFQNRWAITGPTANRWVKMVLLYAAKTGDSFAVFRQNAATHPQHPNTVVVAFRKSNNLPSAIAWYDRDLDAQKHPLAQGLQPIRGAELQFSSGGGKYNTWVVNSAEDAANKIGFIAANGGLGQLPLIGARIYPEWGTCRPRLAFSCTRDFSVLNPDESMDRFVIGFKWPYRDQGPSFAFQHKEAPNTLIADIITGGILTIAGGAFGNFIGIVDTAANAAFAAAVGTFSSGLIKGQDPLDAFLNALQSGGIAYVGQLALNAFGDPTGQVGVSGIGCPRGDQCWFLQLGNRVPPLKHLAELHDPFITWSEAALPTLGGSGWYLAVTIPPFAIPGCAATPSCVTGGIVIANESERKR